MRKSREKRQDVYGGKKQVPSLMFVCRCLDRVKLLGNTGDVVTGFIVHSSSTCLESVLGLYSVESAILPKALVGPEGEATCS